MTPGHSLPEARPLVVRETKLYARGACLVLCCPVALDRAPRYNSMHLAWARLRPTKQADLQELLPTTYCIRIRRDSTRLHIPHPLALAPTYSHRMPQHDQSAAVGI